MASMADEKARESASTPDEKTPLIGERQRNAASQEIVDGYDEEAARAKKLPEIRECVVCMTSEINTLAIPCRHSTMCSACMAIVRKQSNCCPLCRAYIDYVSVGKFESEFVDWGGDLADLIAEQTAKTKATATKQAYENICFLMAIGLIFTAMAIYVSVTDSDNKNLIVLLAALAFVLGYVPWFCVTVDQLESGQKSVSSVSLYDENTTAAQCLAKSIILPLVLLLFVIVFFIPYFLAFLPGRGLLTYGAFPVWRGLLQLFLELLYWTYRLAIRPSMVLIGYFVECLVWLFWALGAYVLMPFWNYVLVPIGNGIANSANCLGRVVVAPCMGGCGNICEATSNALAAGASAICTYAVTPFCKLLGQCCEMICCAFGNFIYYLYIYVLEPIGKAWVLFCSWSYTYVLAPVGYFLLSVCGAINNYVLQPVLAVIGAICASIPIACGVVYANVIAPVGGFLKMCAEAVFTNVLQPVGGFFMMVAIVINTNVLQPVGQLVGTLLQAIAALFASIFGVIADVAHSISAMFR